MVWQGLGDLLATANSSLSRNYRFGLALGHGETPAVAEASCEGTVEGIATTRAVAALAQQRAIAVPVAQQVIRLLDQHASPGESVAALMHRDLQLERRMTAERHLKRRLQGVEVLVRAGFLPASFEFRNTAQFFVTLFAVHPLSDHV